MKTTLTRATAIETYYKLKNVLAVNNSILTDENKLVLKWLPDIERANDHNRDICNYRRPSFTEFCDIYDLPSI